MTSNADNRVDPLLVVEFIEKQKNDLDEIEFLILKLDTKEKDKALSEIKRLMHTLKGEAGVLNLDDIQLVCHATETYLEAGYSPKLVDKLLHIIDWLATRNGILAGKTQVRIEPGAALVQRLFEKVNQHKMDRRRLTDYLAYLPDKNSSVKLDDKEFTAEYVTEARDHLSQIEQALLVMEKDLNDQEAAQSAFRSFHTIKGGAGMLGLEDVGLVAHAAEGLLSPVKSGESLLKHTPDYVFAAADKIKTLLLQIETSLESGSMQRDENTPVFAELLNAVPEEKAQALTTNLASQAPADDSLATAVKAHGKSRDMVKVDTDLLDKILNAIGELVITESMVQRDFSELNKLSGPAFRNMRQLAKITRELQHQATNLRMTSLKPLFGKMARLARDVSKKIGKEILFNIEGEETELDRNVVESIGDPLVHMIRNAVDHGIEDSADDRTKRGKPAYGSITLSAYHQGGSVIIEIKDDGKGLDRDLIYRKGIEKGLITPETKLTDSEIYNLIFHPGFSTAKALTDVSGRGIGMDVVKKNVENLRGHIKISSASGQGTSFLIVLPLTLAIIDAMIVRVGSQRYLVPACDVRESLVALPENCHRAFGKGESLKLRERLLPIYRLHDLFSVQRNASENDNLAVIVEAGGHKAALLVDAVEGQQQVVIKNLGAIFVGYRGVSGGAIMSDGSVGLILDIVSLLETPSEAHDALQAS